MARKPKKNRIIPVDFEGVESGGRSVPDGTYTAKIESVEQETSKSSGEPMLVVKWRITSKKGKGTLLYDNISLQPQALWRLKALLEAADIEVPDSSLDIDLDELEALDELTIEVTNEKYEGKDRSRITGYIGAGTQADEEDEDADEEEEDEEEEEEKKPARRGRPPKKPAKDEDDEDDEDEEEEDERASNKSQHKAGLKKLKKGALVRFKDEKGKPVKGTVLSIDGDLVRVEDDSEEEWEIEVGELTVVG